MSSCLVSFYVCIIFKEKSTVRLLWQVTEELCCGKSYTRAECYRGDCMLGLQKTRKVSFKFQKQKCGPRALRHCSISNIRDQGMPGAPCAGTLSKLDIIFQEPLNREMQWNSFYTLKFVCIIKQNKYK